MVAATTGVGTNVVGNVVAGQVIVGPVQPVVDVAAAIDDVDSSTGRTVVATTVPELGDRVLVAVVD